MAKEQKIQGGTVEEKLEIAKQYSEETKKIARAEQEKKEEIARKKEKKAARDKKTKEESEALKQRTKEYRARGKSETSKAEEKEKQKQAEAFDLYNARAKHFDAYSKMMEAQSNAERITFNSLAQKYNFARGQVSKMPVSTEALNQKLSNKPELQEAPEFDPKTGRILAQLAGSIMSGLGPSHASVKSSQAVGTDVMSKGVEQNIIQHKQILLKVEKRNMELVDKYNDDITGLFKEYDKAENQSLRDYARNQLKMDEINFRKEAKALEVEARNADRNLRAKIASVNSTQKAKQMAMQNMKYKASLEKGQNKGIWNIVSGGDKINYRKQILANAFDPSVGMARNEALHDFVNNSTVPDNVKKLNWNVAQKLATSIDRIIDKEEDSLVKQRMYDYAGLLFQKTIIVNPDVLRELASNSVSYDITSLEAAYRQRIPVPAGFNATISGNAMKVSANPTEQELNAAHNLAQGVRFALIEMRVGKFNQANFEEGALPFGILSTKKEKIKGSSWGGYAKQ